MSAFCRLRDALVSAPIMASPDWNLPFKVMGDASDFAVGAVLGQRKEGKLHAIYYASKTLDETQCKYTTTEKEFLAVVFAFEKFRSYLLGSKVVVYTDHAAIKYLMKKRILQLRREYLKKEKSKRCMQNQYASKEKRVYIKR